MLLVVALGTGAQTRADAATDLEKGIVPILGGCVAELGCQTVRIGAGTGCDNTSIRQALQRVPALTQIRVVAGSTTEDIRIEDRDLHLIGGFASCADAENGIPGAAGQRTTIVADDLGIPALDIRASDATPRNVVIERIAVTGVDGAGQGAMHAQGHAGAGRTSPLRVTLRDSRIHDNRASLGGGVYVRDAQLTLARSRIEHNEGIQRGGGIYCLDGTIRMPNVRDAVADNTAVSSGGGLHIDDCLLEMQGGGGNMLSNAERGGVLRNSVSLGSGGGIFARGTSRIETGPIDNPGGLVANIEDNRANALDGAGGLGGGGLFLTDDSYANITNTAFNANRAGSDAPAGGANDSVGGAIAVSDGARIAIVRIGECDENQVSGLYPGLCTRISDNRATGAGGAIHALNADIEVAGAYITRNASGSGGAIDMTNPAASWVDASLLARNTAFGSGRNAQHVVSLTSGIALLRSLTLVDNEHTLSSIGSGIADLQIRAVLIDDRDPTPPPALQFDSSAPPQVFCLNAHESASFPLSAVNSRAGTARWSEAQYDALDVRLVHGPGGSSDMIDACSAADATGVVLAASADGENQTRGHDVVALADLGGPVDVGLDEFVEAPQVDVFADGFE